MKELSFNHGRLSFSLETYEMEPCLPDQVEIRVRYFYVGEFGLIEAGFTNFDDFLEQRKEKKALWLHLSGSISNEFWKQLAIAMELSDEEIQYLRSPHKGAIYEDFPNAIFWSFQRPSITQTADTLETVNFLLCNKILITRQFSHDYVFNHVAHYLMSKAEQLHDMQADKLSIELMKDVIKSYAHLLQEGGTRLESIQNKIIRNPGKEELNMINRAQQIIWIYLNTVWPLQATVLVMLRSKNHLLTPEGREELGHRYEEICAVVNIFETYRAMSYDLMDVYVSGLSLRTNETSMVLTTIATLFLPPTLIAGIYGMNFQIPEYHVQFGYYICLAAMFIISGGLLFWFRHKGFIRF